MRKQQHTQSAEQKKKAIESLVEITTAFVFPGKIDRVYKQDKLLEADEIYRKEQERLERREEDCKQGGKAPTRRQHKETNSFIDIVSAYCTSRNQLGEMLEMSAEFMEEKRRKEEKAIEENTIVESVFASLDATKKDKIKHRHFGPTKKYKTEQELLDAHTIETYPEGYWVHN